VESAAARLPAIWEWALQRAALTFPAGTGVGADNFAPRAVARLSAVARSSLAAILMATEKLGQWGNAMHCTLIVLLPKTTGGLRPIGLQPLENRLWCRVRQEVARGWEAAHALPCLFGAKGMGAQRAAWLAAFKAEAAAYGGEQHVMAMLDLKKAFEMVDHGKLLEAARRLSYDSTVLRLSLQAYKMRRAVGTDGVYAAPVYATRGITAGSGFATTELRILLLEVVREVLAKWGDSVDLMLYVDDLTVTATGSPKEAARRCSAVVHLVMDRFRELGMVINADKSVVTATSPAVAATAARQLRSRVKPRKAAKLLGTTTTAGRTRTTKLQQARIAAFKRRKHRYHALRRSGVDTAAMVAAAGAPSMLYGVETAGIADTALRTARVAAAQAAAP
jgi:hypothetical protein